MDRSGSCWLWTGARCERRGHGVLKVAGRQRPAHREAYRMAKGETPPGAYVLHRCGNILCVRPAHLYTLHDEGDRCRDWRCAYPRTLVCAQPDCPSRGLPVGCVRRDTGECFACWSAGRAA
ncbi:MAG TPA: HNH endonuclease [Longimicrobiaceae bacterium]